jgi:hypothetical protein
VELTREQIEEFKATVQGTSDFRAIHHEMMRSLCDMALRSLQAPQVEMERPSIADSHNGYEGHCIAMENYATHLEQLLAAKQEKP